MGSGDQAEGGGLVLLMDNMFETRRASRHMLEQRGLEVVQASNGMAGLELVQRLPQSFRFVLVDLDLPGLPSAVVLETLRLFRPELPVLCMGEAHAAAAAGCLTKPLREEELVAHLSAAVGSASRWVHPAGPRSEDAVARARARFAVIGDLVEAALELARGLPEES
ncbi:MAG: response regulator [Gemmatimonadales bacterium]|nr:response regulator [Gemmatimonadales bacterium]